MFLFFFLEWIRNDLLENSLDSIFFFLVLLYLKRAKLKIYAKKFIELVLPSLKHKFWNEFFHYKIWYKIQRRVYVFVIHRYAERFM